MDSTPDVSHTDQLSVVLRIVNCESSVGAVITEHFCGFIDVLDTSGKGLYDTLLEKLEKHNLKISDCRGQSYDNGSNMMGSKQGVQARILQLNNKNFRSPLTWVFAPPAPPLKVAPDRSAQFRSPLTYNFIPLR